jgi:5-formyltetrahydrofolate cyclo-ligase
MSDNPEELKAAIRKELRAALSRVSPELRVTESARLRRLLTGQPVWTAARSVFLFFPIGTEPDVWPLAGLAMAAGKVVVLPRYSEDAGEYHACELGNAEEGLVEGRYGVREPAAHRPRFSLKHLDLALVPGIGFTLDGGRLGRGKGYYDRLLAGVPGFKCGVAFDCQITGALPLEPHDVRLNCILTPTRWHSVVRQARS